MARNLRFVRMRMVNENRTRNESDTDGRSDNAKRLI